MASRSDSCHGPFAHHEQVFTSAKLPHYLTKLVHSRENSVQRSFQPFLSWEEVSPAEPILPARACLSVPPPPHPSRWMSRTPPGPPRSSPSVSVRAIPQSTCQPPSMEGNLSPREPVCRSRTVLGGSFCWRYRSIHEARRWRSREGLPGGV